jgi:2-methylcitrate dehydratase PrpD
VPQYEEPRLADPVVQDLSRRVGVYVDEALATNEGAATAISNSVVYVETTDGRSLEHRVPPHRPMSWAEIERKFRSNASVALDTDAAEQALALARSLPTLDDAGTLAAAFAA